MKNLLLLFLLFPLSISAQNWMPVNPGETYHYRLGNADFVTHTIRVDSVEQLGNQTNYFLNRVGLWDTLAQGSSFIFKDQGQFLYQTITDYGSGKLLLDARNGFSEATITLYTLANPGFNWVADEQHNITATVSSVALGAVLGVPDSLKTIQFSNGDQWVLSKNHGVVSCPNLTGTGTLTLSGLESLQLGDRLYRFEDFFDMEVGTLLEYVENFDALSGWGSTRSKNLILSKSFAPDLAEYQVQRKWKKAQFNLQTGTSTTFGVDTFMMQFNKSDFQFLASYNNQFQPFLPFNPCDCKGTFAVVTKSGVDIGEARSFSPTYCGVFEDDSSLSDFNVLACSEDGYFEQFRPGLGQTEYYESFIDNSFHKKLVGAVVQGDTVWGSISPDWNFTATSAPGSTIGTIGLSPNPASDYVEIQVPGIVGSQAQVQIFSAENKLLRSQELNGVNGTNRVNLSGLPTGFYLVLLQSGNKIWRAKLIKS